MASNQQAARVMTGVSGLWEATSVPAWRQVQFGRVVVDGKQAQMDTHSWCRLLESNSKVLAKDQVGLLNKALGASKMALNPNSIAFSFESTNRKDTDIAMVAWAACRNRQGRAGQWAIPNLTAGDKDLVGIDLRGLIRPLDTEEGDGQNKTSSDKGKKFPSSRTKEEVKKGEEDCAFAFEKDFRSTEAIASKEKPSLTDNVRKLSEVKAPGQGDSTAPSADTLSSETAKAEAGTSDNPIYSLSFFWPPYEVTQNKFPYKMSNGYVFLSSLHEPTSNANILLGPFAHMLSSLFVFFTVGSLSIMVLMAKTVLISFSIIVFPMLLFALFSDSGMSKLAGILKPTFSYSLLTVLTTFILSTVTMLSQTMAQIFAGGTSGLAGFTSTMMVGLGPFLSLLGIHALFTRVFKVKSPLTLKGCYFLGCGNL
ncbi:MAG: hypothetical protein KIA58_09660 [Winkia neuii]|uniref:hypothetical protein n=1 Tax=Winkia neuii TaxID=33007 RepID=UPI00241E2B91|nr:hypothetical protein [Winkia neuii]MBS5948597.1 hypothetical protein [Winkia neuii]